MQKIELLWLLEAYFNPQPTLTKMSFIQSSANISANASQQATRQLYNITRSEATWLVTNFIAAQDKAMDGSIEPFRVFRDALETEKPAYLGKFNNSQNAVVQGTFYAMAGHIYQVIQWLFAKAGDINHDAKVKALCKHLPTSEAIAYVSITYLNWAVYNWHFRNEKTINEELSDNCYETHTCAICAFHGKDVFYYSTAYGLEQAVCEICVEGPEEYEKNDDEEYVPSESEAETSEAETSEAETSEAEASEAETSEAEAEASDSDLAMMSGQQLRDIWCVLLGKPTGRKSSGVLKTKAMLRAEILRLRELGNKAEAEASDSDDEEDDPDYVCEEESDDDDSDEDDSDEDESDEDDSDEDESDASSNETEETDVEGSETDSASEEEAEKSFGCEGCRYEWRNGWRHGWAAAMKTVRNYAALQKNNEPEPPRCATCDNSHADLKKCSGHCGGLVRYCSERCQREDWAQHKLICRL